MSSASIDLSSPEKDPLLGALLQDRYRVVRRLGAGGMGVVYEGEHVRIKRRVAIKCLHAQFAEKADVLARFHREALAATSIGNEHIVEVTDMDRLPGGAVFLVLEFLDGRDLGKELKNHGRLSVARCVHILSQMCEALAIAHEKGIVHRDLKPDNVYLITRGADADFVKILDFGISKFRDVDEGGHALTATGAMLGTPMYMAPEQFSDTKTVDQRADIYALGCILFRCLAGRTPYHAKSLEALIGEVLHAPMPDLAALRPDLPAALVDAVHRMLCRQPDGRFDDCAAVRAALQPFAGFVESSDVFGPSTGAAGAAALPGATPPSAVLAQAAAQAPGAAASARVEATRPPTVGLTAISHPYTRWALFGAGGLALAAFVGVAMGKLSSHPTDAPTRTGTAPSRAPITEVAAPSVATRHTAVQEAAREAPSVAAAPREVHVRIRTTPPGAELYVDTHRFANPFDGELPATATPHRLEARLAGYRTVVVPDLVLEFSQTVEIPMSRGSGEERRATNAAHARGSDAPVVVAARVVPAHDEPAAQGHETPAVVASPGPSVAAPRDEPPPRVVPPPPQIHDPF